MRRIISVFCVFLIPAIVRGVDVECLKSSKEHSIQETFPDVDKVLLKDNYEINIRYTNWLSKAVGKFVEKRVNDTLLVTKTTRQAVYSLYEFPNETISYKTNTTNAPADLQYECRRTADVAERNIYELSPLLADFLGVAGNNFSAILAAVVSSTRYNSSSLDEKGTNITAGVSTIGWLGCAESFRAVNATVQANVYFSGEFSQLPYNGAFKNPLVYSIHLQAYAVDNSTNSTSVKMTDHVSFDVVTIDDVHPTETMFSLPRGRYCHNMPKAEFPQALPSRFKARLQYFDAVEKSVDDVEVLYDEKESIFSFASNFKSDRDIPFVGHTSFDGNARIVHDFQYGLQYVLSRNGTLCYTVEPIDAKMGDVKVDENGTLFIRNPAEVLFNTTNSTDFYFAGKVVVEGGLMLNSYVSEKPTTLDKNGGFIIVEVLYTTDEWNFGGRKAPQLHSIVQYHANKSGVVHHKTTINLNVLLDNSNGQTSWIYNNVLPCLSTFKEEELFFIALKNVTLPDLQRVGFERVENALIEAVAHVANISVLRITNFMFTEMHSKLLACFIVSQKSNVKPATTACLKPELSVDEIRVALNNSINATNTFNLTISSDGTKGDLVITSNEFGRLPIHSFPPPPAPAPVGYSASSMFVLGLFMFIFGVSFVLTGYVFYIKRQSIRGMAYQVFE